MKKRYMMLAAITAVLFLTGCHNRFEEYEPYSTFDERMAESEKGKSGLVPDDQMPPPATMASGDYSNEFTDDNVSNSPRKMQAQQYSGGSSNDLEVPFSSSRGAQTKHAVNIGAL